MMSTKQKKDFYRYVRNILSHYKLYIMLLLVLSFFTAYFPRLLDLQIARMIDSIQKHSESDTRLFWLFIFYKLMHHTAHFGVHILSLQYIPRIAQQVTRSFYQATIERPLGFFGQEKSGEIVRKILDFQWGLGFCLRSGFYAMKSLFYIALSLYYLFPMHAQSAWVLTGFIGLYAPVMFVLMKKQYYLSQHFSDVRQETTGLMTDSLMNNFRVKVISGIRYEVQRWIDPILGRWARADRHARRYHAFYLDLFDTILVTLMFIAQMWFLVSYFRKGQISGGQFAFVIMSTLQVHKEVSDLVEKIATDINPNIAMMETSYQLIRGQKKSPLALSSKNTSAINLKCDLVYDQVSCSYQSDGEQSREALNDISVTIPYGQRVGLVGPSGSGKSTFIKCFLQFFQIDKGSIFINGTSIQNIRSDDLYTQMSVIPQNPLLFHRSIYENLRSANPKASDQEIKAACIRACVHDEIMALPKGYHTTAGERGESISGGQRQRIALACAFLKRGHFFVCDEGTSALDILMQNDVNDAIIDYLNETNSTAIIAAHRLSALRGMNRILVFNQGRIVEDGSHDTLMSQNSLYKTLWNNQ